MTFHTSDELSLFSLSEPAAAGGGAGGGRGRGRRPAGAGVLGYKAGRGPSAGSKGPIYFGSGGTM